LSGNGCCLNWSSFFLFSSNRLSSLGGSGTSLSISVDIAKLSSNLDGVVDFRMPLCDDTRARRKNINSDLISLNAGNDLIFLCVLADLLNEFLNYAL